MVNIFLESYNIDDSFCYHTLERYIKPQDKVTVIPFSFRDRSLRSKEDWRRMYGKHGKCYGSLVKPFSRYGISEEQIVFLNYFEDDRDDAIVKIESADILYFLGGVPDRMMERIHTLGIADALLAHNGVVMGYSAGALVQLREYHVSPDRDYPTFGYYQGLSYLDEFYLEVHYEGCPEQDAAIQRVLRERGKKVYATTYKSSGIIVDNGRIATIGNVYLFE